MIVLGIETSCDETAVALVNDQRQILAHRVLSQMAEHTPYGGVVPEVAARAHLEHCDRLVAAVMADAGLEFSALDGIAATGGPGLIGGVIVGVTTGKAIALARNLPFIAVNHLEGHALTVRLSDGVAFPYLLLLVSGGHCQLLLAEDVGQYRRLGTTRDDAAGEAFDKVAKLLGLGWPGGPRLEQAATAATNPERFTLPRPMLGRPDCDFSFSGLKTAVRQRLAGLTETGGATPGDIADLAAAFQNAVAHVVRDRTRRAMGFARSLAPACQTLVAAGGVAANGALRHTLMALATEEGWTFTAPPLPLCTDNGAMIAWAGLEHLRRGEVDKLDFAPRPRWPLG